MGLNIPQNNYPNVILISFKEVFITADDLIKQTGYLQLFNYKEFIEHMLQYVFDDQSINDSVIAIKDLRFSKSRFMLTAISDDIRTVAYIEHRVLLLIVELLADSLDIIKYLKNTESITDFYYILNENNDLVITLIK